MSSAVPTVPFGGLVTRPLIRHLARPLLAFLGVVLAGVVGFITLADVGVVDATFWLLDPTSIELHFAAHEGPETLTKAFAVVVLAGLVVSGLWIGETFISAAFGGQLSREFTHMQIERAVDDLDDHVIVCGYGTFGKTIVSALDDEDRDVVVVEIDETQFEAAIDDDVLAIQGDARNEGVLAEAGLERAGSVVGAVDDANVNIQTVLAAGQLAPTVRLVVRVGDETDATLARRAGADEVVIPEVLSGKQVGTSV